MKFISDAAQILIRKLAYRVDKIINGYEATGQYSKTVELNFETLMLILVYMT